MLSFSLACSIYLIPPVRSLKDQGAWREAPMQSCIYMSIYAYLYDHPAGDKEVGGGSLNFNTRALEGSMEVIHLLGEGGGRKK